MRLIFTLFPTIIISLRFKREECPNESDCFLENGCLELIEGKFFRPFCQDGFELNVETSQVKCKQGSLNNDIQCLQVEGPTDAPTSTTTTSTTTTTTSSSIRTTIQTTKIATTSIKPTTTTTTTITTTTNYELEIHVSGCRIPAGTIYSEPNTKNKFDISCKDGYELVDPSFTKVKCKNDGLNPFNACIKSDVATTTALPTTTTTTTTTTQTITTTTTTTEDLTTLDVTTSSKFETTTTTTTASTTTPSPTTTTTTTTTTSTTTKISTTTSPDLHVSGCIIPKGAIYGEPNGKDKFDISCEDGFELEDPANRKVKCKDPPFGLNPPNSCISLTTTTEKQTTTTTTTTTSAATTTSTTTTTTTTTTSKATTTTTTTTTLKTTSVPITTTSIAPATTTLDLTTTKTETTTSPLQTTTLFETTTDNELTTWHESTTTITSLPSSTTTTTTTITTTANSLMTICGVKKRLDFQVIDSWNAGKSFIGILTLPKKTDFTISLNFQNSSPQASITAWNLDFFSIFSGNMGFALHSKDAYSSDSFDDESVAVKIEDVSHYSEVHAFGWNKKVTDLSCFEEDDLEITTIGGVTLDPLGCDIERFGGLLYFGKDIQLEHSSSWMDGTETVSNFVMRVYLQKTLESPPALWTWDLSIDFNQELTGLTIYGTRIRKADPMWKLSNFFGSRFVKFGPTAELNLLQADEFTFSFETRSKTVPEMENAYFCGHSI